MMMCIGRFAVHPLICTAKCYCYQRLCKIYCNIGIQCSEIALYHTELVPVLLIPTKKMNNFSYCAHNSSIKHIWQHLYHSVVSEFDCNTSQFCFNFHRVKKIIWCLDFSFPLQDNDKPTSSNPPK